MPNHTLMINLLSVVYRVIKERVPIEFLKKCLEIETVMVSTTMFFCDSIHLTGINHTFTYLIQWHGML